MLIVVRRDDHQLAVINTDGLVQVVWLKAEGDDNRWSVQMSHGRKLHILTAVTKVAMPTTAAGTAITPDKLLTTLAGGPAA
ncbi:hypothetical protein [Phenylobacterium sp.]|jgi:hypothetical protein|uniref:hypothetical protein n=1 Tax=Phenylobacterium sp. TaxID=1871053 RepID=UPI002E355C04|nr:hypothetical protein [Phenylobacterium sp.]HEX4712602.1 hypothetical protein [Phenylobacterium sp.]